jgi:hypothetical protein
MSETVAVTINVAPGFEERIVDWLLARDVASGFTTYAAYGHGAHQDELSVAEQVSGRQRRMEFRIEIPAAALEDLVQDLTARFAGVDLYYFVTNVLRSGHLRGVSK